MQKHQKIILSVSLLFIAINLFLVPVIGFQIFTISDRFPFLAGYIIAVLFLAFLLIFLYKRSGK